MKFALGMMCVAGLLLAGRPAAADPLIRLHVEWLGVEPSAQPAWLAGVQFVPRSVDSRSRLRESIPGVVGVQQASAQGFEYSQGYQLRDRIHHDASYAMLPLFALEAYLGEQLFAHPEDSRTWKSGAHAAGAVAIGGLLGVNTVTGIWNFKEAGKDPVGARRRLTHAVLMLVADGGYLATSLITPSKHIVAGRPIDEAKRTLHREFAYFSVSVATVGYVLMLFK